MITEIELRIPPERLEDGAYQRARIAEQLGVSESEVRAFRISRRSLDARQKAIVYLLRFEVALGDSELPELQFERRLRDVSKAAEVVIVGFGPAGMFAALRLVELGLKPVIYERGKPVRERRYDIARLNKGGAVDRNSNYCFGEGGAGTFSDGKLYTRSTKRGSVVSVLQTLVSFGASSDILIDTHPHIGSNKLPNVVQAIREALLASGAEVHFSQRVDRLLLEGAQVRGVVLADGSQRLCSAVLFAIGHSARDSYRQLHTDGILLEPKELAVGVRVEHPQAVINEMQYRGYRGSALLPAARYTLNTQVQQLGVFSFCMCPGGIICPSATEADQVVVNGWSPSKRNSQFANSGIVTELRLKELAQLGYHGPLAVLEFQESLERRAAVLGGGKQRAPGQRLQDLLERRASQSLGKSSYRPGVVATDLRELFPKDIFERLRGGFQQFGAQNPRYLNDAAQVLAVETRSSAPIRIPRDSKTRMHSSIAGLFPAGEGAGYAGGIMSAAIDGTNSAEAISRYVRKD